MNIPLRRIISALLRASPYVRKLLGITCTISYVFLLLDKLILQRRVFLQVVHDSDLHFAPAVVLWIQFAPGVGLFCFRSFRHSSEGAISENILGHEIRHGGLLGLNLSS